MKTAFGFLALLFLPLFGQPAITNVTTDSRFGGYIGVAAAGSYVNILGSNLAGSSRRWDASDFTGAAAPTVLDGVSVTVNGTPAFVSYVSSGQVNIQIPDSIAVGPATVVVSFQGLSSAPGALQINAQAPGLYMEAFHGSTGGAVTTANPATPRETLNFYGTGFGPVTQGPVAGQIAAAPVPLTSKFSLTIGGSPSTINFAGLGAGLVGLYQFTIVAPALLPSGNLNVISALDGLSSERTFLLPVTGTGVPSAPTSLTATPGNGSVTLTFARPASSGTSPVIRYTASCLADGLTSQIADGAVAITATAAVGPLTVSSLANGTAYSCNVTAANTSGSGSPSTSVTVTPVVAPVSSGSFVLTSTAGVDGGTLPSDYTCDGMGSTIQLSWTGAPAGTQEYALLMTTLPGDGTTKWNWVLSHIPGSNSSLPRDNTFVGTLGVGSDGPGTVYNPPCSQGPGSKLYTYTLYALSSTTTVSANTGQGVTDAISAITLGQAVLNLSSARPASTPGSSAACVTVRNSTRASKSGIASVSCDTTYAYVGSNGITTQPMMNGITSTNLQVPIQTNFNGLNAWKIPLTPAIATAPTSVVDGPLGVAINGVPIFNPCTQGGCVTGGDTKALGQLDTCNGHAGRAEDYHYHAAPICMMADQAKSYWDTHPLGWALDGFAIFGYNDADGTVAARDATCGGNTKTVPNAPAGYSYHVTDAPPYVTNCLVGTPSPDLAGQGAKYHPIRQPPVTPFNVTGMTLTTDPDGYQVLQFTSARNFTTNEMGTDSYQNLPGTYRIRFTQVLGDALPALLAQPRNLTATACWNFQFLDSAGATTQPSVAYCK